MTTVRRWTGREANALQAALRLSNRGFAEYLGVGIRTVTKWQARGANVTLRPAMQSVLDTALNQASSDAKERFELLLQPDASRSQVETNQPSPQVPQSSNLLPLLSCAQWQRDGTEALSAFLFDTHDLDADTALRLSREWRIVDPPQVVEVNVGRRVGDRLARLVVERADMLRRMDDFLGGGDMHDLVRRELQVTLDMVRDASYSDQTGRALLAAVGELAQLAGWVASDAGLYAQAERYYLGGVTAAHAAKNEPLAANLLSSLAYQVSNVGDTRKAVLLASTAYNGAEEATATTRALLLERVAWANARLGDATAVERALGDVDEIFTNSKPSEDPPWVYWLNRNEIDVMAGRCLTQLKRPKRAIELLNTAVRQYDETHVRELTLYLSWLVEAHIYAENIDEAAEHAIRALRLSTGVTSERGTSRMRLIRDLLTPYHGNAAVDAFEDQARGVLPTEDR